MKCSMAVSALVMFLCMLLDSSSSPTNTCTEEACLEALVVLLSGSKEITQGALLLIELARYTIAQPTALESTCTFPDQTQSGYFLQ